MDKLPFTVYDFFGYLASGLVLLVGIVAAFVGDEILSKTPGLIMGFFLVVAVYIAGQVVANVAGDLLERRIVRKRLGMPTAILLGKLEPGPRSRRILPGYFTPFPKDVQDRVATRAERFGVTDRGEPMFFHCYATNEGRPGGAGTACDVPERLRVLSEHVDGAGVRRGRIGHRDGRGNGFYGARCRRQSLHAKGAELSSWRVSAIRGCECCDCFVYCGYWFTALAPIPRALNETKEGVTWLLDLRCSTT